MYWVEIFLYLNQSDTYRTPVGIKEKAVDQHEISAIILAAGRSSRMQQFKPLLPMGKISFIERCIALFKTAGISNIIVVAGHRAKDIVPVIDPLKVQVVINRRCMDGMFSSVTAGIERLVSGPTTVTSPFRPAFFVLPVDIPLIRPHTLSVMLRLWRQTSSSILYPTFWGERGHPPLIGRDLADNIMRWSGSGGLRGVLEQNEHLALNVAVMDEAILMDCDTLADYEHLRCRFKKYDIPTDQEARAMMAQYHAADSLLLRHCETVAYIALHIAKALNNSGASLDCDVIKAAALLHDILRHKSNHAEAAAEYLTKLGYPAVAEIVGRHMDIRIDESKPVSAAEVIYLADKLVKGDTCVTIGQRFAGPLKSVTDKKVHRAVMLRKENALKIKSRIEKQIGYTVEKVVSLLPSYDLL